MEGLGACRLGAALFTLKAPRGVLKHNAITVGVFEGPTLRSPVWIEWRRFSEAGSDGSCATPRPLGPLRHIQHNKIFLRGRRLDRVRATDNKLEMHLRTCLSNHCPVEAVVPVEFAQHCKAKAGTVHLDRAVEVGHGTSNAKVHGFGLCARV